MWNWITELNDLQKNVRPIQPVVLVTVTRCSGSTPRDPGTKMIVFKDGDIRGTIGGGRLEELAIQDAKVCIEANATARTITYPLGAKTGQCCGGVVELLMEVLFNGPHLYIFGAGHVGQALSRTMAGTPFLVHLVDEREEWIQSDQIPEGAVRYSDGWEDFIESAPWDAKKTYSVIMTHRHDLDQQILEKLLDRNACYIGLIGSKPKWVRFSQRLQARQVPSEKLARVKCPIGIPFGGKSPQEVAISVSAEILSHYYGMQSIRSNVQLI